MSLIDAMKAIDIAVGIGIKKFILIGGEPTLYKNLVSIANYLRKYNISPTLVTNGLLLNNISYLDSLIDAGITKYSLSLKGVDSRDYEETTKYNGFGIFLKTIENLENRKCSYSISIVITNDNIFKIAKCITKIRMFTEKPISLSFCYHLSETDEERIKFLEQNNPKTLINNFTKVYRDIDEASNSKFKLSMTFPLCFWNQDVLKAMEAKKQTTSVCQLIRHNGIIFDTDLSILPCNAMTHIKIAEYRKDYNDDKTLLKYINSRKINGYFNKLRALPSKKCLDCDKYSRCGGGCVVQYSNYSLDEMLDNKF